MSPDAFGAVFDVSRETVARLATLADMLVRWNARINLVAPSTLDDIWRRHIADSAQLLALVPDDVRSWLDLGAGAGFPGLVIATMAPQIDVTLIESDRRKAAFLRAAASAMGTVVRIHARRIEHVSPVFPDVISARALAPLPRLLPLAARFTTPATVLLLPKGARVDSELTACAASWHSRTERFPSMTDPAGVILRLRELRPHHAAP